MTTSTHGLMRVQSKLATPESIIPSTYCWRSNPSNERKNSFLLPSSFRACTVGKSNSGKTNLVTYLLLEPGLLDYNNLVICARSLSQPEYQAIRLGIENNLSKKQIRSLFEAQDDIRQLGGLSQALSQYEGPRYGNLTGAFYDSPAKLPDPSSNDGNIKSFFLFDDVILDSRQDLIKSIFARGRHHNIHCVYISQNYWLLDRRSIRENSSIFFIFKQDFRSITHIYHDHVASDDIELQSFRKFAQHCWSEPYSFMTIDLTRDRDCGKYRRNLTEFWCPILDNSCKYLQSDNSDNVFCNR